MALIDRLVKQRFGWVMVALVLLGANWVLSLAHGRVDLTREKRYTLSEPTHRLMKGLTDKVEHRNNDEEKLCKKHSQICNVLYWFMRLVRER
jgi:hypothetical protein